MKVHPLSRPCEVSSENGCLYFERNEAEQPAGGEYVNSDRFKGAEPETVECKMEYTHCFEVLDEQEVEYWRVRYVFKPKHNDTLPRLAFKTFNL